MAVKGVRTRCGESRRKNEVWRSHAVTVLNGVKTRSWRGTRDSGEGRENEEWRDTPRQR
jgi:hypothetical protein